MKISKSFTHALIASALWAALCTLFLLLAGRGVYAIGLDRLEIPAEPEAGAWYRITPEGALSADGSPWHGMFRKGTENKVLIWFYGGGMSLNEDMASHPSSFYASRLGHDGAERRGMGSDNLLNPFHTWTVLAIPYSTADLHLGAGEFTWSDQNGSEKTLFHHGYSNFKAYMEKAMPYLETPEALIISGYSAGGFGAAMLADEIITDYFPETENCTLYVESALLLRRDWQQIAEEVWHAPEHLLSHTVSDNLMLDGLRQLSQHHPGVKILFSSSIRDYILSAFQNYFATGEMNFSSLSGDVYLQNLRHTASELQKLPNTALFLWKEYYLLADLTAHTYSDADTFFLYKLDGESTLADWLLDAVSGNLYSLGTGLLDAE